MSKRKSILGTDIGGTFIDCVRIDENGEVQIEKLPTPGESPSEPVADEVKKRSPDLHVHGTTIATNAVLERDLAEVAFVTTEGFRDLLKIARQNRPSLYDFNRTRRPSPVSDELLFEISGRLDASGEVLEDISSSSLESLKEKLRQHDPESIAVCLLHAYKNKQHEKRVAGALQSLDCPISLSSNVLPEFREYERASTTVLNAGLMPVVQSYLEKIPGGTDHSLQVMKSTGGLQSANSLVKRPVELILSGPAGGVVSAKKLGDRRNRSHLINLDMGGTSTDISLIHEGDPVWTREAKIDELPLAIPVLDIETIGAGGGSIARLDAGGALQVGPRSAGADPGPVCYDRGGEDITVTDAHLLLGHIGNRTVLAEKLSLNPDKTRDAFESFADQTQAKPEEIARGILDVVDSRMSRAIRNILVRQGGNPEDFTLVAFGGAGPLHACSLAERLGIKEILIPPNAGVFSAVGILQGDIVCNRSRTLMISLQEEGEQVLNVIEELCSTVLQTLKKEGLSEEKIEISKSLDLRYEGQSYELNIPYRKGKERLTEAFHQKHEEVYGFSTPDEPVEVVNVRVDGCVHSPEVPVGTPPETKGDSTGSRKSMFASEESFPVYQRSTLGVSQEIEGKSIVEEMSSTLLIESGWSARVKKDGSLLLSR